MPKATMVMHALVTNIYCYINDVFGMIGNVMQVKLYEKREQLAKNHNVTFNQLQLASIKRVPRRTPCPRKPIFYLLLSY